MRKALLRLGDNNLDGILSLQMHTKQAESLSIVQNKHNMQLMNDFTSIHEFTIGRTTEDGVALCTKPSFPRTSNQRRNHGLNCAFAQVSNRHNEDSIGPPHKGDKYRKCNETRCCKKYFPSPLFLRVYCHLFGRVTYVDVRLHLSIWSLYCGKGTKPLWHFAVHTLIKVGFCTCCILEMIKVKLMHK